jgi:hypothetical protein
VCREPDEPQGSCLTFSLSNRRANHHRCGSFNHAPSDGVSC